MNESNPLEEQALKCDKVALELEKAAQHMRTMSNHFRNKEVPRAGAHALAAQGHLENARAGFIDIAVEHASKAVP